MYLYLLASNFEYLYFKAMNVIAKLSFWILQPKRQKQSTIAKLSKFKAKKMKRFEDLILTAFDQFKTGGYVEKIKTSITQESLPSNKKDLVEFLFNQIAYV